MNIVKDRYLNRIISVVNYVGIVVNVRLLFYENKNS